MIPTNFKPADPHFIALVLPVLMQIGELRARGWPIDYSDPPFMPPMVGHQCGDCACWRDAGSRFYRTGWCRKHLQPMPPDASRFCFE